MRTARPDHSCRKILHRCTEKSFYLFGSLKILLEIIYKLTPYLFILNIHFSLSEYISVLQISININFILHNSGTKFR